MGKIKKFLFTMIIFVAVGFGISTYFNNKFKLKAAFLEEVRPMSLQMPNIDKTLKKIKVTDVLIENIVDKKELITMETELKEDVAWDDSFTDWGLFKKIQNITFYGVGKYSTDLSLIGYDDINFDFTNNIVTLEVKKPVVNSLELLEDKTQIYNTDNGLLRFGEMKITASEQNELYKKIKNAMNQKMSSFEMLKKAEEKTIQSVKELVTTFLISAELDGIEVKVFLK